MFKFIMLSFLISQAAYGLNYTEYLEVKVALEKTFLELRPSDKHKIIINMPVGDDPYYWWNLDYPRASYSGLETDNGIVHHVFLFGGYIRLPYMTKDLLANTGCHEIAHGLGGYPFKSNGSSMEPQADYWATKECLALTFKYISEVKSDIDYYAKILCDMFSVDQKLCYRMMTAIAPENDFFEQSENESVRYDDFAREHAVDLNDDPLYYPSAQCRFDSMIHGILDLERPLCWYPNGRERILINE